MDARQQRAEELLATGMIHRQGHVWFVPSQSGGGRHAVVFQGDAANCDCSDFELRQLPCKHIIAVKMLRARELLGIPMPQSPETPPVQSRKTYSQSWTEYNAAQTNEKVHFQDLLAELCRTVPEPLRQKTGRRSLPLADSLFASVFKVYSTVSARRFMCDLAEARERGHIGRLPHFNSVLNGLDNTAMTPILFDLIRQSALPLCVVEQDFAVDSSGFMTSRFVRWYDQKYGTTRQKHEWVKVHLVCGVKTNIVTAVEILDKGAGDSPRLPSLIEATAKGFRIAEVSADNAYASRDNFDAVDRVGGTLYAAFQSSATGGDGGLFTRRITPLFAKPQEDPAPHPQPLHRV